MCLPVALHVCVWCSCCRRERAKRKIEAATSPLPDPEEGSGASQSAVTRQLFKELRAPRPIDWVWLREDKRSDLVPEGVAEKKTRLKLERQATRSNLIQIANGGKVDDVTTTPALGLTELVGAPLAEPLESIRNMMDSAFKVAGGLVDELGLFGTSQRDAKVLETAKNFLQRIQLRDVALGWNTWKHVVERKRANVATLTRVMKLLANDAIPLARGFRKWQEYADEYQHATARIRSALVRLTMAREVKAFDRWQQGVRDLHRNARARKLVEAAAAVGQGFGAGPDSMGLRLCPAMARCLNWA